MSEIEKKEEPTEIEKVEEKPSELEEVDKEPSRVILTPEMCSWIDEEGTGYEMEVYLPGVEKDTIKLRMTEDTVFVAGDTDRIRYVGYYTLCCPVEHEKATSLYKNGLLKIHVPYKEIEMSTVDVAIE
ncbi:MAG: Hsp20/alpha crystallin family protein [Promethearchaeota archaeon]